MRKHIHQGFSLIEVAVVILALGLILGLSLSLINSMDLFRSSKSLANTLADSLVTARNAAMQSGKNVYFVFNLDENYYRAYRLELIENEFEEDEEQDKERKTPEELLEGDGGALGDLETEEKPLIQKVQLPEKQSLQRIISMSGYDQKEGEIKVRFLPNGAGEGLAVYLGPYGEEARTTITYNPYLGRSKVSKGEVEYILNQEELQNYEVIR